MFNNYLSYAFTAVFLENLGSIILQSYHLILQCECVCIYNSVEHTLLSTARS